MRSISFKKIAFVALWAASLLLVAQWGHGQTSQTRPSLQSPGTVISGDQIGFRFEGFSGVKGASIAVKGQWMVKMDGTWWAVEAPGVSVKPLSGN